MHRLSLHGYLEQNLMGRSDCGLREIAAAAAQAMKSVDLNRFLVVCALVSDLYCPGYNPKQSLAKDSNLARAAARCKIDAAKITVAVRAELTKKNGAAASTRKKKKSRTVALSQHVREKAKPSRRA